MTAELEKDPGVTVGVYLPRGPLEKHSLILHDKSWEKGC